MKYKVYTNNARKTVDFILSNLRKGEGYTGKRILTWQLRKTQEGEEVLVHTTDQWADKGCIALLPSEDDSFIEPVFYYWSTFQNDNRTGDESKYMLGRLTELFLVHFEGYFNRISIL